MSISKTCTRCAVEKPYSEFQRQASKTKDGYYSWCKACKKISIALQKERKIANGTWDEFRLKRNDRYAKQSSLTPIQCKAQNALCTKVKSGKIIRLPCEVCGEKRVHGHHDDYAKPLEVRWLCSVHHAEWHLANGPGANGDKPASDSMKGIAA
jgi:hypothetical protein